MSRVVTLTPDRPLYADGAKAGGWWHDIPQSDRIHCDLCPRACELKPGDRGFCFVRENRDGEMALTTYGRSTGFCVDPIEKKPLNHFYPGTSVLSFGTAGCNLGCKFCQNWDISKSRQIERLSDRAGPAEIAAAAASLGCRSVAFTYNDPVIWAEYAIDVARACHAVNIKTVAVTAGYITRGARGAFFADMDAANVDLKGFTEEFYQKLTLSHLQPVLDTLQWLKEETDVWFEITNLIIPQANDAPDDLARMCDWILHHVGDLVPIHFTAFHPDFRLRDRPPTPHETLLAAYDIARQRGLKYVYVGNVHDQTHDSTFCHHCGRLLVERDWHQLGAYHLSDSRCGYCQGTIPGHYDASPGDWGRRRLPVRIADFVERSEVQAMATRQPNAAPKQSGARAPATASSPAATNEALAARAHDAAPTELTDEQQRTVHQAACRLVAAEVGQQTATLPDPALEALAGKTVMGAFVTLKRAGALRACCGVLGKWMPLSEALRHAARRTAREDVRMPAVSATELPYLELDVSLLHGFRKLTATGPQRKNEIEIGRHGLQIRQGQASGLLLPNVATEHKLDAEQFLRQVCRKAGLPATAWQADDCELVTFESCFVEGPFDTQIATGVAGNGRPLLDRDDLARLAEHCQRNVLAHLQGATPSYYLPDCPDGMVHGAALTLTALHFETPLHVSQISLRPALPLQATLANLAGTAANVLQNKGVDASQFARVQIGLTVHHDPAMHGTAVAPDLRGLDPKSRALLVRQHNHITWVLDPNRPAEGLLEDAIGAARLTSPALASLYSLAAMSTEPSVTVSTVPTAQPTAGVRPPAVSGTFYPAEGKELDKLLDDLWDKHAPVAAPWRAAMVPHAGLQYSGRIAAAVWQRLKIPETVIIIGPKHTPLGVPWAVAPHESWSLPGACLASDPALARTLADGIKGLQLDAAAHRQEHAIEVELPFLARLAPTSRVVGIAIGMATLAECIEFAHGLAQVIGRLQKPPLLVISSDMNHFANDDQTRRLDRIALDALERLDPSDVYHTVTDHHISMCGVLPAVIVLETLRQLGNLQTCQEVGYATSADVSGDTSRVVGYAGLLFN